MSLEVVAMRPQQVLDIFKPIEEKTKLSIVSLASDLVLTFPRYLFLNVLKIEKRTVLEQA